MHNDTLPGTLFAFLWHFIRRQPSAFAIMFSSTMVHALESNGLPYALKRMVDTVSGISPGAVHAYRELLLPACMIIGMWTLVIIIWRIQEYVASHALPKFQANMRMALFNYVQGHSHTYFSNHFAGTIAGKIGDLPRAATSLVELTRWRVLTTLWVAVIAVVWLGTVSLYFSLVLGGWIIIHMLISFYFARRITGYADQHAGDENILRGHIIDILSNFATVRLFAGAGYERGYIGKYQQIEQESNVRTKIGMLKARGAIDVPFVLLYVVMLCVLIHGWAAGWVTAGDMVFVLFTVFNVVGLVWMLGTELPQFFNEAGVCRQALSLITQAHGITDAPNARPLAVTRGEIAFDNVHFHYIPGRDIFRDKNITIQAGQKVGLVGFSGSGKSTFVNLILRLYDVESGRILIDGQDIAAVTQASLRSAIAMIPQDTTLFHRTLMENIRYGRPDATDDEVLQASARAHCHEFIAGTQHGYDSLVGERGVKLSGGQRQRIAIARAILKNAPILILDEATSSLDSITEKYIQQGLDSLMQGRTTIIVAHRLSTLAHLDRILVFKDGEIIEDGTHTELLAAGGHYARLWGMQAGGFLPGETAAA